jgi:hypothetical protein
MEMMNEGSATTLSITRSSITTLSAIKNKMRHSAQWQIIVMLGVVMLNVVMLSVAFIYYYYAECRSAECHGAMKATN